MWVFVGLNIGLLTLILGVLKVYMKNKTKLREFIKYHKLEAKKNQNSVKFCVTHNNDHTI